MLVSALELAEGMNENSFSHKNLEILLHRFWLTRQINYQGLALGANNSSREASRRHYLARFLGYKDHK